MQPGPYEDNVVEQDGDKTVIVLATKARPPLPVIAEVATRFPQLDFTLVFHHEALILGGHYQWTNGAAVLQDESIDADRIVELLDRTAPDIAESVRTHHGLDARPESETRT